MWLFPNDTKQLFEKGKKISQCFFFLYKCNKPNSVFLFPQRFIFSWVVWLVSQSVAKILNSDLHTLLLWNYFFYGIFSMGDNLICDKSITEQSKNKTEMVLSLESLKSYTNRELLNLLTIVSAAPLTHPIYLFVCILRA